MSWANAGWWLAYAFAAISMQAALPGATTHDVADFAQLLVASHGTACRKGARGDSVCQGKACKEQKAEYGSYKPHTTKI